GGWLLSGVAGAYGRRAPRRLAGGAWLALLVGSAASFGLFGAEAVAGSLGDAFDTSVWGDLATTQTGRMLVLRIALAGVFGALLALRRQAAQGWWRSAAFTAAVVTVYTFSASGHPNSQEPAALWIAVDLVHLAAITVWIGGLLALVAVGRVALAEPDGGRLVRRFSLAASICVPLIVATGVAQTLQLAGGLDDITATDWGRLLLTKVTVVAALLAVAGVSRWLLQHDGPASVRRTVIVEFVLGMVVVAMAAGMVALPPEPPVAARPFAEQLSASGLIGIISLSPGSVGGNEVHITMTPPGGSITPIVSATARVSLPSAEIPFSPVTLVKEGPNHYSGSITFPRSGDWTFEVIVKITDTEEVLLKTTVPIP
ncbi:MAG: CopD family protein, partial [Ilumatobacteraceae bacterium]